MSDLWNALLADVVNDSVEGSTGPMDWTRTDAALEMRARRITYENARRIHEGWYAEEDDEPIGPSGTDDPWEVMPCGHCQGEIHDCESGEHERQSNQYGVDWCVTCETYWPCDPYLSKP